MFYLGALKPREADMRAALASLESVSATPFPIRFVTALSDSEGLPLASGTLDGLYCLPEWRTGALVVVV